MSKEEITAIDSSMLSEVTGGTRHGDPLLNDLGSLASQIKDLTTKTSGFDSTQLLLLCCVALQRQNNGCANNQSVVYVSGPRRWW